jgi:hypothetical protein
MEFSLKAKVSKSDYSSNRKNNKGRNIKNPSGINFISKVDFFIFD